MTEDVNPDSKENSSNASEGGMEVVLLAFGVAVAAGLGFLIVYWTGGSNILLGGTLALCFGGLGTALVIWAHSMATHHEAAEPRETVFSEEAERQALSQEFLGDAQVAPRRNLLKGLVVAGTAVMGAMAISLLRSLGNSPFPALDSTIWKRGQRLMMLNGKPVSVQALQPGSTVLVFPEGRIGEERAQTVLIRVDPQSLQLPKGRANWAPLGYVAYSRVCTHAGCPVGLYEATIDTLLCPCHQSTFDVLRGAQPTGGPAARPLPQLPLYADSDGNLRAGGGFTAPPGPGFWEMRS